MTKKRRKKRKRRNLNEDGECQQGDDTSKLVCRFQSNGINATSVTANVSLQTEEVEVKVSKDLVDLFCTALPGGNTSDACINIQTMSTSQFKALLWVDSDPFRGERSNNDTIQMYALAVLFWSTNGLQLKGAWMDHFIPYCKWQGIICQNNQNRRIIEINLLDTLCNEGSFPIELRLLSNLGEICGASITTLCWLLIEIFCL